MDTIDLATLLKEVPKFSVLAGAGLSAPAPTCLPGWWALNDAVLAALGDAIERVSNHSGLSGAFCDTVRRRRETTPFLKPDLQAQLIEDEVGDAYFRGLASVDSDTPNAAHHLLCEFARQGRLAAILTTNFDTTIERALDAGGVPYSLFTSPDDFERLNEALKLPVVKIHGSASKPGTMIDTLRQRLQQRPTSLERWMVQRFVDVPTIGLGFSCEDLQYDPDYLGIRPAVRKGARFFFLVRTSSQPSVPLRKLVAEFPDRVSTSDGDLPGWLFGLASDLGIPHDLKLLTFSSEEVSQRRTCAARRLDESMHRWVESLGTMNVMNAATALLAAAGSRHAADYLLRRMWWHYRDPEDCSGLAYARYLHNYGETLLRAGALRNPYDREQEMPAWKAAADRDPTQFFFRAVLNGGGPDSMARALLCKFLAGARVSSLADQLGKLLASMDGLFHDGRPIPRTWIDACFSVAELLELLSLGQGARGMLETAHRSSIAIGDELRRAEAAWRLARNLAFRAEEDAACESHVNDLTSECNEIARRLDIREADAGAALARTIDAIMRKNFRAATETAQVAEKIYSSIEDLPGEMFAKRERLRAHVGEASRVGHCDGKTWDDLSRSLQMFAIEKAPGFRPIIKFELALFARYFDDRLALELATDAADDALLQEHPLLCTKAAELRDAIAKEQP